MGHAVRNGHWVLRKAGPRGRHPHRAFGDAAQVALGAPGSAEPGANRTVSLEFQVADADAEFERLKGFVEVVQAPKTMPWGNRSAQFRDPEGTLILLYAPVTEAAKARFADR